MSDYGSPPGAPRRSRAGRGNAMSGNGSPPISPTRPTRARRARGGRPRANANTGMLGGLYAGLDRVLGGRIQRVAAIVDPRRGSIDGILNPPPAYEPPPTYQVRDDSERFGRLEAEMANAFQEINRRGSEINRAIVNHAEQVPAYPGTGTTPFQWTAPLDINGPDCYDPLTGYVLPRRLPGDLDLAAQLKPVLMKADDQLRTHLLELATIRDWWKTNRNEWGLRRQDIQFLEVSIEGLQKRLGGEADDAPTRQQLELQRELANSKLGWFAENERHMDAVEKKFKKLAESIDETVEKFKTLPENVNESFNFREDFSYDRPHTAAEFIDGQTVRWFSSPSMTGRVVDDMTKQLLASNTVTRKMADDRLQEHHYLGRDLGALMQRNIGTASSADIQAEIDTQRGRLRDATSNDPDLDHPMLDDTADAIREALVKLEAAKRDAERWENEYTERKQGMESELAFLRQDIGILGRERKRGFGVANLMRKFELNWINGRIDFDDPLHVEFFHDVYNICRIHYLHTINLRKTFADLADKDFLAADKTAIYNSFSVAHTRALAGFQPSIDFMMVQPQPDGTYSDIVLTPFKNEAIEVETIHQDARNRLAARKALLALSVPKGRRNEFEGRLREITLGDSQITLNRRAPAWQSALGQVNTLQDAETLLQTGIDVMGHNNKSAYEALREFFVSPDIADNFRFLYNTERPLLLEVINSFLRTPIHDNVLDAFLLICHDRQDLFQLAFGSGKVSSLDQGWELVEENAIAGPNRLVAPVRPFSQAFNIEQWLLVRKDQFILPNRDIDRAVLGRQIAVGFPEMAPKELMEAIHFFSAAGRLYRIARTQPGGVANNVRRIDNGWGIDAGYLPNYESSPLAFSSKTEAFCKSYLKCFKGMKKNMGNLGYVADELAIPPRVPGQSTEAELFAIVEDALANTFSLWEAKIVPTPHRFHLFLRWCTQNHPTQLRLTRNGVITGDLLQAR